MATESQIVFLKQLVELLQVHGLDGIENFENDAAWAGVNIEKALALSGIPLYHPARDVNYDAILEQVGSDSTYTTSFYWDLHFHAEESGKRTGNLFEFLYGDRGELPGDSRIRASDPLAARELRRGLRREGIIRDRRRTYYRLLICVALLTMAKSQDDAEQSAASSKPRPSKVGCTKRQMAAALRRCGSVAAACRELQISRTHFYAVHGRPKRDLAS